MQLLGSAARDSPQAMAQPSSGHGAMRPIRCAAGAAAEMTIIL
jgi:hypothetical protein